MRALLLCLTATALLLAADLAGSYKGDWSSNSSGGAGAIQITVKPGSNAAQTSEVTFTLSGADVKTRMRTLRIDGNAIEMSYEFGNESTQLISALKGKLEGDKLSGTYRTTYAGGNEQVDEGTFKATLVK